MFQLLVLSFSSLLGISAHVFCVIFSENIIFSSAELSEIKRVSTGDLRLLGFKPLSCLKDYHNLRPSTFLFPSDKVALNLLLYYTVNIILLKSILVSSCLNQLFLLMASCAFQGFEHFYLAYSYYIF